MKGDLGPWTITSMSSIEHECDIIPNTGTDCLAEIITNTLVNAVDIQEESRLMLMRSVQDAGDSVVRCEASVIGIEDISYHINKTLMPEFRQNVLQLEPLFTIIDTMHKDILPLLECDLAQLEQTISSLDRSLVCAYPTTMQSFLNVIKLPASTSSFSTSECVLHNANSLQQLLFPIPKMDSLHNISDII